MVLLVFLPTTLCWRLDRWHVVIRTHVWRVKPDRDLSLPFSHWDGSRNIGDLRVLFKNSHVLLSEPNWHRNWHRTQLLVIVVVTKYFPPFAFALGWSQTEQFEQFYCNRISFWAFSLVHCDTPSLLPAFLLSDQIFLSLISTPTCFHEWGLVTRWAQLLIKSWYRLLE